MYHYFGRPIFDSMIVIATEHSRKSKLGAISDEDVSDNRVTLNRAFQLVLAAPDQKPEDVQDIPQPPIFYLSLEESSSSILGQLQKTTVTRMDGLKLQLQENTCARCSLKFGVYKTETVIEPVVIRKNNGRLLLYDQSRCHPLIIPKYSKVQKVFGGIAYIVLLGIPLLAKNEPWPGFLNHDEKCAKCENHPGSPGCTLISQKYVFEGYEIEVKHMSELDKVKVVQQ